MTRSKIAAMLRKRQQEFFEKSKGTQGSELTSTTKQRRGHKNGNDSK